MAVREAFLAAREAGLSRVKLIMKNKAALAESMESRIKSLQEDVGIYRRWLAELSAHVGYPEHFTPLLRDTSNEPRRTNGRN